MTRDVEVGDELTGRVVELADLGAVVELGAGVRGLLHVSRILPRGHRLRRPSQVLATGDVVRVAVAEVQRERGLIGLDLVARLGEDGGETSREQLIEEAAANPPDEQGEGGDP